MRGFLRCPVCHAPLDEEDRRFLCEAGHSFDRSSHGFVNLLLRQKRGCHGDNRDMVRARRDFLNKGYYEPLAKAIVDLCLPSLGQSPVIADAGCGEGYYAAFLDRALKEKGVDPSFVCLDISREALRFLHKRLPEAHSVVGGSYDMPIVDGTLDLLLCLFAPLVPEEFSRTLKQDGLLCMAVPGRRHLFALKEILYKTPYENVLHDTALSHFELCAERHVHKTIRVESGEDVMALFAMTPYYYRTPPEGHEKIASLSSLETEVEFHVFLYKKTQT